MKTFLKVILYLLGFPLMIGAVVYVSLPILEAGKTYGIWIYGGIGVTALIGLIYLAVGLITWNASRKAKTLAGIRKATAALVICAVLLTTGIWFAIDMALPPILDDATSGTILYEDVRDDYIAKSEVHGLLLTKFIEMNVANGNLTQLSLEQYLAEGYGNEEVKNLIHDNFQSIDQDGYATFKGPWVDLASDDRMTIPTIVHLVINDRYESTEDPLKEDVIFIYKGEGREEAGTVESPIKWTVLDMQEGVLSFDIDALSMMSGLTDEGLTSLLEMILTDEDTAAGIEEMLAPILGAVNDAITDEALAGSVITVDVNIVTDSDVEIDESLKKGTINIAIVPANESRGVWDYMNMAWLDSNNLLFTVISLFPARRIMLVFGGLVVILSLIIGAIRESQYKKNLVLPAPQQQAMPYPARATVSKKMAKEYSSPYMKACYRSFNNYDTRGSLHLPKSIDPNDYTK